MTTDAAAVPYRTSQRVAPVAGLNVATSRATGSAMARARNGARNPA